MKEANNDRMHAPQISSHLFHFTGTIRSTSPQTVIERGREGKKFGNFETFTVWKVRMKMCGRKKRRERESECKRKRCVRIMLHSLNHTQNENVLFTMRWARTTTTVYSKNKKTIEKQNGKEAKSLCANSHRRMNVKSLIYGCI